MTDKVSGSVVEMMRARTNEAVRITRLENKSKSLDELNEALSTTRLLEAFHRAEQAIFDQAWDDLFNGRKRSRKTMNLRIDRYLRLQDTEGEQAIFDQACDCSVEGRKRAMKNIRVRTIRNGE